MTTPSPASLDVIVVSHNTRADLEACLGALHAAPPGTLGRIVVVDNASADGSPESVRRDWAGVRLIALDRNIGFGAANNVAIRESQASLVLLLNSDAIAPPRAIDTLIERLTETGAVAAGPRLVDDQGRPEVSFGSMLSPWSEVVQRARVGAARRRGPLASRYIARLVSRERHVDWVTGACLLLRRQAALDAGLFDERYFMYEEDVDLCAALRARGGRILFTPRAEVVHRRGRSIQTSGVSLRALYDQSHLRFYEKHHPGWAPLLRWWQTRRKLLG
jgi:N-acetylglucosaminyl-diphospho-decaprenol L-rhamnosyltransferase